MVQNNSAWVEWMRDLGSSLVVICIPLWVFINKYFDYQTKKAEVQSKRDREFISQVVKEVLESALVDVRGDLKELKDKRDKDMFTLHGRIDDVFKELKKS